MNALQDPISQVICPCTGTTVEKVQDLLVSGRASDVDKISRITGACSGCGGCEYDVMKLIEGFVCLDDAG